jgi:hypothetical protein
MHVARNEKLFSQIELIKSCIGIIHFFNFEFWKRKRKKFTGCGKAIMGLRVLMPLISSPLWTPSRK